MSKTEQHVMDHIIRDTLNKQISELPAPNMSVEEAWKQLEANRVNKKETKPVRKKFFGNGLLVVAVACLLFFIIWTPQKGVAFDNWFLFYNKIQGSVVQIFGGNSSYLGDKDAPIAESEDSAFQVVDVQFVTEQLSLSEAQEVTEFTIETPIVPEDYRFTSVTVLRVENELSSEITLNYVGDGRQLLINQKLIEGEFGFGMAADGNDTKVKELVINDRPANLITFKNGVRQLIWTTSSYYYSIEGNLEEEEIVAIAKSM